MAAGLSFPDLSNSCLKTSSRSAGRCENPAAAYQIELAQIRPTIAIPTPIKINRAMPSLGSITGGRRVTRTLFLICKFVISFLRECEKRASFTAETASHSADG